LGSVRRTAVRPLLVCDDEELALELSEDLLRLGRNVEAVEIEEKFSVTLGLSAPSPAKRLQPRLVAGPRRAKGAQDCPIRSGIASEQNGSYVHTKVAL
jgi:hypothetical protein